MRIEFDPVVRRPWLGAVLACAFAGTATPADIFQFVGPDGVIVLTDRAPISGGASASRESTLAAAQAGAPAPAVEDLPPEPGLPDPDESPPQPIAAGPAAPSYALSASSPLVPMTRSATTLTSLVSAANEMLEPPPAELGKSFKNGN